MFPVEQRTSSSFACTISCHLSCGKNRALLAVRSQFGDKKEAAATAAERGLPPPFDPLGDCLLGACLPAISAISRNTQSRSQGRSPRPAHKTITRSQVSAGCHYIVEVPARARERCSYMTMSQPPERIINAVSGIGKGSMNCGRQHRLLSNLLCLSLSLSLSLPLTLSLPPRRQ